MIAANIIVFNEQQRIGACLSEISQWADEIVIVDQASTDNTAQIINEYVGYLPNKNIKLINDKHWGFCEPSRILAWENTESEWIGVVDADERFSYEFMGDMPKIINGTLLLNDHPILGTRLKRSLYVGGEHRFTGDYQYRFFRKDAVRFVPELHTDPQPTVPPDRIHSPIYVGIWHEKSWTEQIRDELAYEQLLLNCPATPGNDIKLALNVHLKLLRSKNITAEQADAMTIEERKEQGINAPNSN